MIIIIRPLLALLAFIFVPVFCLAFNLIGVRIGLVEFYGDWYKHLKSGEHWGFLDESK